MKDTDEDTRRMEALIDSIMRPPLFPWDTATELAMMECDLRTRFAQEQRRREAEAHLHLLEPLGTATLLGTM